MYTGNVVILFTILMNMILNLFYAIVYLKVHHTKIVNIDDIKISRLLIIGIINVFFFTISLINVYDCNNYVIHCSYLYYYIVYINFYITYLCTI